MIARDIMTENPVTVSIKASIGDVIDLFMDLEVRHLPVLEGRALVGIVSDRDLRGIALPRVVDAAAVDDIRSRYDAPVSSIMSPDPISVNPDAEMDELIDLILEHKIGAVPVVDESSGDLLGIVSYVDLLRGVRDEL